MAWSGCSQILVKAASLRQALARVGVVSCIRGSARYDLRDPPLKKKKNVLFLFFFEACRHGRAMLKAVAAYRLAARGPWSFLLEGFRSFDRSCPCRTADGRNDSTVLKSWCSCTLWRSRDVPAVVSATLGILLADASSLLAWASVWKPLRISCLGGWVGFDFFLKHGHGRAMLKAVAAYRLAARGPWSFLLEGFRSFDRSCPCRTADGRNDSTVLKSFSKMIKKLLIYPQNHTHIFRKTRFGREICRVGVFVWTAIIFYFRCPKST